MRNFQCLLFVLKVSYMLLYDCSFNSHDFDSETIWNKANLKESSYKNLKRWNNIGQIFPLTKTLNTG